MPKWILVGCLLISANWLLIASAFVSPAYGDTRVVALGGDITAIIYALDAEETLVGVDSTSVWPAAAQQLPNVGYVRQLSAEGILALRPTLIIANHDAGPPAVIEQLKQLGVELHVLPAEESPDGIIHKVQTIGQLVNKPKAAAKLAAQLKQQAKQLRTQVASMAQHPRTVFLMSASNAGLMVSGLNTSAHAALELAGGNNVVSAYSGYKPLSAEGLIKLKPQVLILMNTGQGEKDKQLLKLPAVSLTPAGRNQQVIVVDGQALLGFGMRTLKAASKLQKQLEQVPTGG